MILLLVSTHEIIDHEIVSKIIKCTKKQKINLLYVVVYCLLFLII